MTLLPICKDRFAVAFMFVSIQESASVDEMFCGLFMYFSQPFISADQSRQISVPLAL
jgi:hypothetical protein